MFGRKTSATNRDNKEPTRDAGNAASEANTGNDSDEEAYKELLPSEQDYYKFAVKWNLTEYKYEGETLQMYVPARYFPSHEYHLQREIDCLIKEIKTAHDDEQEEHTIKSLMNKNREKNIERLKEMKKLTGFVHSISDFNGTDNDSIYFFNPFVIMMTDDGTYLETNQLDRAILQINSLSMERTEFLSTIIDENDPMLSGEKSKAEDGFKSKEHKNIIRSYRRNLNRAEFEAIIT